MDLRRMKQKVKPKFDLTKRIKPNPKYENVQSQVNTGNNTRKQLEKYVNNYLLSASLQLSKLILYYNSSFNLTVFLT